MPYVISGTAFVVRRVSGTQEFEWFSPSQDHPPGAGDYTAALTKYSSGDPCYSIDVHTMSTLDTFVSGTWTQSSAILYKST